MVKTKLQRSLPTEYKITIKIVEGTHATESSLNKQLNDKERVESALENINLIKIINKGIKNALF